MGADAAILKSDLTKACPCCAAQDGLSLVVETPHLPVNPTALISDLHQSINVPMRPVALMACSQCGFMWNGKFEDDLVNYDADYEGTQGYSPHFRVYLNQTVDEWLEKAGKQVGSILEVGCGQGEFLTALKAKTDARLVGYDPAYRGGADEGLHIFAKKLPEAPTQKFDLVISRMTLEHMVEPDRFMAQVAKWVAEDGCLITNVPNAAKMVADGQVCDLIYEHVNYFNASALTRLMERVGFGRNQSQIGYGNQHLTLFSRRGNLANSLANPVPKPGAFSNIARNFAPKWRKTFETAVGNGQSIFVWGAGSRATTFLNLVDRPDCVEGVIDINPRRQGTFVHGTPHQTFLPEHLSGRDHLLIVMMNPIYRDEISDTLRKLNVAAELRDLSD